MPIYEYECKSCHHHLEADQRISEAPLKKCPSCKKPKLQRVISSTNFQLKGGGWYVTDFKDKPKSEKKVEDKKVDKKDSGTTTTTTTKSEK